MSDYQQNKWQKKQLNNLADIRLSSVDKKITLGECDVQLCNYTDVYYNSFITSDMEFMKATATDREMEKCTLMVGDVLITKDSEKYNDIGVPALVREKIDKLLCGYHLAILRPLKHIDGPYLFYALSTKDTQQQFHSYANGVTRFGLRKADIGLVELISPPLSEQRAIAYILSTLDDKIKLNRRMNETLEAIAQSLFKSWFVNFDPVRAKMEGRDTGLPRHLADLFPDRLVSSDLSWIPEGWKSKTLDECFDLVMGQSPAGSSYNDRGEGLPFFQGRTNFGFRYPANLKFCTAPIRKARPGDTLVSVRAPVGDINMAWTQCCIGRGVAASPAQIKFHLVHLLFNFGTKRIYQCV